MRLLDDDVRVDAFSLGVLFLDQLGHLMAERWTQAIVRAVRLREIRAEIADQTGMDGIRPIDGVVRDWLCWSGPREIEHPGAAVPIDRAGDLFAVRQFGGASKKQISHRQRAVGLRWRRGEASESIYDRASDGHRRLLLAVVLRGES